MLKRRYKAVYLLILFFSMPNSGLAALFIDDTYTTRKGKAELDFGLDYYKDIEKEFDPETEEYNKNVCKEKFIYSSITYGLADNCETYISVPYKFLDDSSEGKINGFSDIEAGVKYRFRDEGRFIPSYASSLDIKTASANEDKGLGSGENDLSVNSIFTKSIGKKTFDLNLGYAFVGGKPGDIFFYSFGLTYDLNEKASLCNEIYGEKAPVGGFNKNIFCYALSLSYQFSDLISFDTGVGIGITEVSPDYQISNSFTLSF